MGAALANVNTSPNIAGRPPRLLIVDDERDNRQLLDVVLSYEGFVCWTAASGADALATVALQPPDLILLDVMMPGMDGFEVATKLKGDAVTKKIPIMMVTAMADFNARERARDLEVGDLLAKPIDRDVLVARLHRLLSEAYPDYHAT